MWEMASLNVNKVDTGCDDESYGNKDEGVVGVEEDGGDMDRNCWRMAEKRDSKGKCKEEGSGRSKMRYLRNAHSFEGKRGEDREEEGDREEERSLATCMKFDLPSLLRNR